jgi:hypothetical protein
MATTTNLLDTMAPSRTEGPLDRADLADAPFAAADNRIASHTLERSGSASARHALIAEAAYHRAQHRGFASGNDWQETASRRSAKSTLCSVLICNSSAVSG